MGKRTKDKKYIDMVIMILLVAIILVMIIFTATRETANQEIILMEIYKSAGPDTSTATMNHYYIYQNTNTIKIRSSNADGSNNTISKEISEDLINNFKKSLDEYIISNPTIASNFYINERYTIEYNGKSTIVPNPSVANLLGYDSNPYLFYNTVENFTKSVSD